ncbi:hypothetical protein [Streptomyces sp. t39]|uniref:hypothetical protein n=1 Tax=Streptomyces sp. t39 TaxID=1828156 RepID=UPI0011CD8151|nr:hypothetical protein [Streptomyces sp. t39]TXS42927.1 hypothetical protein EAO77_35300 [Streptomyces sp. t39]
MTDADTTPLARTAALVHDAQRTFDSIALGPQWAKKPWNQQSENDKASTIRVVERAAGMTFEEFYDFYTLAPRLGGQPVPPSTDTSSPEVRYARMLHAIATAMLPTQ